MCNREIVINNLLAMVAAPICNAFSKYRHSTLIAMYPRQSLLQPGSFSIPWQFLLWLKEIHSSPIATYTLDISYCSLDVFQSPTISSLIHLTRITTRTIQFPWIYFFSNKKEIHSTHIPQQFIFPNVFQSNDRTIVRQFLLWYKYITFPNYKLFQHHQFQFQILHTIAMFNFLIENKESGCEGRNSCTVYVLLSP